MAQTISLERPTRRKASVRTVTGPAASSRVRGRTPHPGVPGEPAAPTLSTVEAPAGYAPPAAKPRGTVVEAPFTVVNPANGQPLLIIDVNADGAASLSLFGPTGQWPQAELLSTDEGGALALWDAQEEIRVLLDATPAGGKLHVLGDQRFPGYDSQRSCIAGPLDILNPSGQPGISLDHQPNGYPEIHLRHPEDGRSRASLGLDGIPGVGCLRITDGHGVEYAHLRGGNSGDRFEDTAGLALGNSTGLKVGVWADREGGGVDVCRNDAEVVESFASARLPFGFHARHAVSRLWQRLRQSRWVRALTCL